MKANNRKDMGIPFTPDDLRYLADTIDKVFEGVGGEDLELVDWRWGLRVEITDDTDTRVGEVRPHGDGWLGFYPEGW